MKKAKPVSGACPNWYRNFVTPAFGEYFGSISSLANGETYLTYDKLYIVHRQHNGKLSVRANVCAHAGAPLLTEPGVQDVRALHCPIHKWGFAPSGEFLGAPYFENCDGMSLSAQEFGVWDGYMIGSFSQDVLDISDLMHFGDTLHIEKDVFNPIDFVFMGEEAYPLPYPRQLMYVNYFDGLHVPLYHQKTFDAVADVESYAWEFSPHLNRVSYSIQCVRARNDVDKRLQHLMRTYGLPQEEFGWADFHMWIKEHLTDDAPIDPEIFAVWGALYGNAYLMPELYEGGRFLAVSYLVSMNGLHDSDTENCNLVEYYVHKSVPPHLRKIAARKFQYAYEQSAREDDAICLTLWEAHRRGGMQRLRLYHPHLEAGDMHWREWFEQYGVQDF